MPYRTKEQKRIQNGLTKKGMKFISLKYQNPIQQPHTDTVQRGKIIKPAWFRCMVYWCSLLSSPWRCYGSNPFFMQQNNETEEEKEKNNTRNTENKQSQIFARFRLHV